LGDILKQNSNPKYLGDIFQKKCAQRQKNAPKWRNFTQSGQTGRRLTFPCVQTRPKHKHPPERKQTKKQTQSTEIPSID
jgi:hypothetical protein